MQTKGQTIIDLPIALFFVLVAFLIFFALVNYTSSDYSSLNKYLVITENAISKHNPSGIGYAWADKSTKITYQNTIEKINNLKDPLKEVKIYYYESNTPAFDIGKATCNKKTIIPRLVIYDGEISKADFVFCK